MSTVIKINGLDVEFSEKVPDRSGVYLFIRSSKQMRFDVCPAMVKSDNHDGRLYVFDEPLSYHVGLWSTSPLVPAVEVEMAYREAIEEAPSLEGWATSWDNSRAKRVTEGGE